MEGWIKLHRKITEDNMYFAEKFTKIQAWIDLLLHANHKDNIINIRGNEIPIKRGQLGWSEVTMSKRWQWSRVKVRRFLSGLETIQQIRQQKIVKITSITTILHYNDYQGNTTDYTTERQQKDNRLDITKNDKNDKEDKYSPVVKTAISRLNELTGKKFRLDNKSTNSLIAGLLKIKDKGLAVYTVEDIIAVIELKCSQWKGTEYYNYLRPKTLFNKTNFEQYVNEKPVIKKTDVKVIKDKHIQLY